MKRASSDKKILLVDDDEIIHTLFSVFLTKVSPESTVKTAKNGKEAFSMLYEEKICQTDLIVLDINMPIMNGFEFLEKQKEWNVSDPVVMLTSSTDVHDLEVSRSFFNVKGYFLKPLSKELVNDIISNNFYFANPISR